ncbi:PA2778 family cysteine peptidase [Arhodomonas sp. AD133]|uniref:PA2778 family cysteine peptidase n=1 Tax=Arhodomonas sp. AD133 TaxID=3415009 RepID=UPI003EB78CB0
MRLRVPGGWRAPVLLAIALLAGCTSLPRERVALPERATAPELSAVPFFPDTAYYCGPAALATTLGWSGRSTTPEALAERMYVPGLEGTLQAELLAAARRAERLAYVIPGRLTAVADELAQGEPVIVLQNLALGWWPRWHYAVVVAVDADAGEIVLRSGERRRHRVAAETFARTWARGGYWAAVTPAPGRLPATATPRPLFRALADLEATASPDAALAYWRAAVGRWPDSGLLALGYANALHFTGHSEAARTALAAAAARAGDHRAEVLNNLAMLQAELGDLDQAEATARSALRAAGDERRRYARTLAEIRCRRAPASCPR